MVLSAPLPSSTTTTTPRLIPHIIDQNAASSPDKTMYFSPRSSDPKDGWVGVSWGHFANAVNHMARWLMTEALGGVETKGDFPTIAYMGPNDGRYPMLVVAAVKAGCKAFFVSPRNTLEGQLSLFAAADCDILLVTADTRKLVQPWLAGRPSMRCIEMPSLAECFPQDKVPHVPFNKTYSEARWDPLVVLHTSGSTGIPKPVIVRQGMLAICDELKALPKIQGMNSWIEQLAQDCVKPILGPMPFFHAAGLMFYFIAVAYYGIPYALGVPDRLLTPDVVTKSIVGANVDAVILPPAIIEQMSQDQEHIEVLKSAKHVMFGGGPLSSDCGNALTQKGVRLFNVIAATESVPYIMYYQSNHELWQYYIFDEERMGIDWRPVEVGTDTKANATVTPEVCRMVGRRKSPDKDQPGLQGWFYTFPEADEYDTKDLFERHPTLPNHWRHVGRGDDIIVFSNGEKLNPITIEDIITSHPVVSSAIVVGAGQFQAGLLLEPKAEAATGSNSDLVDKIWPLVQRANEQTVAHGRIASRDMIIVSNPKKPFARAGKGTVQRAATVKMYAAEIEEMYRQAEAHGGNQGREGNGAVSLDLSSEQALTASVVDVFSELVPDSALEADTDLFTVGVDSLMVVTAARKLRAGMKASGRNVSASEGSGKNALNPRVLYANPTPRSLARYIIKNFANSSTTSNGTAGGEDNSTVKMMQELLDKFTSDLPQSSPQEKKPTATENQTVLLTGSTGMLGGFILENLLANPHVGKVICLNRAADGGREKFLDSQQQHQHGNSQTEHDKRRNNKLSSFVEGLAETLHLTHNGENHEPATNGTSSASITDKVEFHHIDTAAPRLGLPDSIYNRLVRSADRIIHNAWPVNFNIPLSSFLPSLQGVRNFTDLATAAEKKVNLVFVSSIGTIQGYTTSSSSVPATTNGTGSPSETGNLAVVVPEKQIVDFSAAIPGGGYGQSKMLGSLIVDAASKQGGFTGASVRVGQIAGSERALQSPERAVVWNRHEWLPSLVSSSVFLGAIPRSLGAMDRVDWTPVERVAGLITDVAGVSGDDGSSKVEDEEEIYYHGVNPHATTWSGNLVKAIQEHYNIPKTVETGEWVALLEQSQKQVDSLTDEGEVGRILATNSGLKLIDAYRGMFSGMEGKGQVVLDMTKTAARSPSIRDAGPISPEMLKAWCAQWNFGGEKTAVV